MEWPSEEFKFRTFFPMEAGPSTVKTADEERTSKSSGIVSDYLIDIIPSLGLSKRGEPVVAIGSNR